MTSDAASIMAAVHRFLRTAICVAAISTAAACGGSTSGGVTPTPAPSPHATSQSNPTPAPPGLTLNGAFSGTLQQATAKCGQKETVKKQAPRFYVDVTGTLAGKTFDVQIYDPNGAPEFESFAYVLVKDQSGNVWIDPSRNSVEAFDMSTGATVFSATRPSRGAQFGNNPYGDLTITGDASC